MTIERAEEEGIQCGYCLLLPKALESQSKASFLNPTATRAHAHNLPKLGVRGTGAGKGAGEGFGGGEDKDEETDNSSFMICATRSAPSPLQHFFSAPSSLCTVATSGVALCNSKPPPLFHVSPLRLARARRVQLLGSAFCPCGLPDQRLRVQGGLLS